jgi:uncharacterized protein YbaA (DUF1428 family)
MSVYVDGFVIPVPKDKLADYRRLARKFGALWISTARSRCTSALPTT